MAQFIVYQIGNDHGLLFYIPFVVTIISQFNDIIQNKEFKLYHFFGFF